jgi:hypothetical protein
MTELDALVDKLVQLRSELHDARNTIQTTQFALDLAKVREAHLVAGVELLKREAAWLKRRIVELETQLVR